MTTGHRQRSRLAVAAHVVALVGGFLILLYCNRDQWFFGDEWDFLGHRGVVNPERSLWAPHTEHWSTGPILIYRALYARYGVLTYTPYVVVLLLLHVAVAHLLWRLLIRAGVDVYIATALSAVFVLLGAGYENLLWAFQIGFIGSVALGLAAILLVNHGGRWAGRDVAAWFVSVAGLMFSGVSVTMVTVAGITVLMRRGVRQAALTVAVPGLVYLVWFFLIGDQNLKSSERKVEDVFKYPGYIWNGLRSAVEQTVGFPGAGAIIVLGLTAFLLHQSGRASGPAAPAFACALGALMLFAIIATGRSELGVEQSGASRYTYIVMALALPGMGLALHDLAGRRGGGALPAGLGDGVRARPALAGALGGNEGRSAPVLGRSATPGGRAVVCLLLLLVAVHNGGILRDKSKEEMRLEQTLKARILAAAQLLASPAVVLGGNPEPDFSPDIVLEDLRRMDREGKLPPPTRITADDRLSVATVLQYAVSGSELATPFTAPLVDGVVGATAETEGPGCIRLFPAAPVVELHLVGGDPMSLRVTTVATGNLTGYLRVFTPTVRTGAPHVDKVRAGVPVYVNVTATVDQVVLRLPPSAPTQVCGVL
ncbi:MAG: hypothetical protein ACR2KK_18205 [Acidimicrobiales bacterium]